MMIELSARGLSPVRWIGRALLAIGALVAAYVVGAQSLATAMKRHAEKQAFAIAPWDAKVMARHARSLIPATADKAQLAKADALARRALEQDGMAIDALVTLGMDAQIRGDDRLARKYMGFAQTLSRRELQTQLWAIEDAVKRSDVPDILRQYDIALRTSLDARGLLFPVLAAAIADPAIASATARVLAARPRWGADFVFYLATEGPNPQATAGLLTRLQKAHIPVSEAAGSVLIDVLIGKGDAEGAWSLYAASHRGVDRRRSRDPRFVNDKGSRSSFDWQLLGEPGISTSIERGETGNVLAFSVAPGSAGLVARQMQLLPPGSYLLRGSAHVSLSKSLLPVWKLSCQDGRPIGEVPLANSAERNGSFGGSFDVPEQCPVQYLSLIARPHDSGGTMDGEIREVVLYPG